MSASKPQVTLYCHSTGPNPWKVVLLLNALNVTYELKYLDLNKNEQKAPEYTALNPNGRVPTAVFHEEGDFVLWESCAILLHLLDKYDKENKFGGATAGEKSLITQWLFFQASGQGPYFGQAVWFMVYTLEKIPYAIERYQKEVARVWSVLESVLSKQSFLVGGRLTVADLAFVTWNDIALKGFFPEGANPEVEYPATFAWHQSMKSLPFVAAAYKQQEAHAR